MVNGPNTYAAIITDPFGRTATNSVSVVAQNRGYGYDLNGNMTNDGQYSYAWDNADRLTEVRTLAGTLVMVCKYDGLSRRRERILWQDGVGQTNRYVYDGWLVLEIRDDGNHTLETYTHGPDLSSTRGGAGGIGGILSMSYSSPSAPCSMLYALYDGNGNVLAATDTNQTLAAAFEYGPFGTLLRSAGPAANSIRYRFSSKEYDAPMGLYYYGYRYYSPALGRWINRDPLGIGGGVNLFHFIKNCPTSLLDILGLSDSSIDNWTNYLEICWGDKGGAIGIGVGGTGASFTPPSQLFDYSACTPGATDHGLDYWCPCPAGSKKDYGGCYLLKVCALKTETPPGSTGCKIISYWDDKGEQGPFGCDCE